VRFQQTSPTQKVLSGVAGVSKPEDPSKKEVFKKVRLIFASNIV